MAVVSDIGLRANMKLAARHGRSDRCGGIFDVYQFATRKEPGAGAFYTWPLPKAKGGLALILHFFVFLCVGLCVVVRVRIIVPAPAMSHNR